MHRTSHNTVPAENALPIEANATCPNNRHTQVVVQGLTFAHPNNPRPLYSNLGFTLPAGELLCLAGMNGCGKTTLLSLLAGILLPQSGSITLQNIAATPPCPLPLRENSALVLQDADMQIIGGTVGEDIMLTAVSLALQTTQDKRLARQQGEEMARAMLVPFALEHAWRTPVQHLSYGQKRKLCLATALLGQPAFLLLDEPLSGLDYPASLELMGCIDSCREKGCCVMVSTHDLDPFTSTAKDFLFLHPTMPPLIGTPAALQTKAGEYGVRPYTVHTPKK